MSKAAQGRIRTQGLRVCNVVGDREVRRGECPLPPLCCLTRTIPHSPLCLGCPTPLKLGLRAFHVPFETCTCFHTRVAVKCDTAASVPGTVSSVTELPLVTPGSSLQATEIHSRKRGQNGNLQETLGVEEKGRERGLAGNLVGHILNFVTHKRVTWSE